MPRERVPHKTIDGVELKKCAKPNHGEYLPLLNFAKASKNWDKLESSCKACKKKVRLESKKNAKDDKYIENMTKIFQWLKENKAKIVEYKKNIDPNEYLHEVNKLEYANLKRIEKNKIKRERTNNEVSYRLKHSLRVRVLNAIKNNVKSYNTAVLVGCSLEELKSHLESQFLDGMTWDNYAEWHIDHIVPCNFFDMSIENHQLMCFNWRNLQPLWGLDNIEKGDTLDDVSLGKLDELEKVFRGKVDVSRLKTTFYEKKEQDEQVRRERIADTLVGFNKSEHGKNVKKLSHKKRSKTMEEIKIEHRNTMTTKTCLTCQKDLNIVEFNKKADTKDGLQPNCVNCVRQVKREWRQQNKDNNVTHNCPYCEKKYKLKDSVTRHIREKHKELHEQLKLSTKKAKSLPKKLKLPDNMRQQSERKQPRRKQ